jgi:hypothetical protein
MKQLINKVKNKRGFTVSGFLIGILIVCVVVLGFSMFLGSTDHQYSGKFDPAMLSAYDELNNTASVAEQIRDQAQSNSTSSLETVGYTVKGSFSAVGLAFKSYGILKSFADSIAVKLNIDVRFLTFIFAIVTIAISFVIVSAFFRWQT